MKIEDERKNFLLGKKIPLYLILTFSAAAIYGLNYTFKYFHAEEPAKVAQADVKCVSPLNIIRENDYKFTRPLLLADVKGEDRKYDVIKKQVNDYVESFIKTKVIETASVYYCALDDNSQFSINKDEKYHPTDMLAVAKMIALLKQSERNAELLDKKVLYTKQVPIPKQDKAAACLENNKMFTIRSLMYSMFACNDDNATIALNPYVDSSVLKNLYSSIQEPFPGVNDRDYMTAIYDYTRLLKVLYTAGYLTEAHSEFALELMTNTSFHDGILKHIGKDAKVVHYYAENEVAAAMEVHEFAIIYLKNKPYIISIMSKGGDKKNLSVLLSNISKMIYDSMNKIS